MKNRNLCKLLAITFIVTMLSAGCGASNTAPSKEEAAPETTETTVTEEETITEETQEAEPVVEEATEAETITEKAPAPENNLTTASEATISATATTETAAAATTAETAAAATADITQYIIVYDDGIEVSLYTEGEYVFFFQGGGKFEKTSDAVEGIEALPPAGGRIERDQITGQLAVTVDAVKELAY